MTAILLAVGLVVYNNVANKFSAFHGWAYVPMNLAITVASVAVALAGPSKLDLEAIGLNRQFAGGTLTGLAIGLIPVAVGALLLLRGRAVSVLADARMAKLQGPEVLYQVLVRIPIGTALTEEVAFRGVLPALARPWGAVTAALFAGLAFGLWHIRPAINRLVIAEPEAARSARRRVALSAVLLSMGAGLALTWARSASGTLGVPFGIHAAINSGGALLAVAAHRRLRSHP